MRGRTALAIVIASAAMLAALAAVFVIPGSGPTVAVTNVNFVGNGPCGILMTDSGFSAAPGAEEQFSGRVTNNMPNTCWIQSISSETPGFTVVGANVPLVVPSGVKTLSWMVEVPFYFNGNLTLNFTGGWAPFNGTPVSNSTCPFPCISFWPRTFRASDVFMGRSVARGLVHLGSGVGWNSDWRGCVGGNARALSSTRDSQRLEPHRCAPVAWSVSAKPGVIATTARAALTRPRRSRSLRSAARSSASRESSGRPLVISRRLNCRVGLATASASSPSSGPPNATRDSNRVRVRVVSHRVRPRVRLGLSRGAPITAGDGREKPSPD